MNRMFLSQLTTEIAALVAEQVRLAGVAVGDVHVSSIITTYDATVYQHRFVSEFWISNQRVHLRFYQYNPDIGGPYWQRSVIVLLNDPELIEKLSHTWLNQHRCMIKHQDRLMRLRCMTP